MGAVEVEAVMLLEKRHFSASLHLTFRLVFRTVIEVAEATDVLSRCVQQEDVNLMMRDAELLLMPESLQRFRRESSDHRGRRHDRATLPGQRLWVREKDLGASRPDRSWVLKRPSRKGRPASLMAEPPMRRPRNPQLPDTPRSVSACSSRQQSRPASDHSRLPSVSGPFSVSSTANGGRTVTGPRHALNRAGVPHEAHGEESPRAVRASPGRTRAAPR